MIRRVASEFANAESKAVRELKRDLESAVCSAQDRDADDGTNPYKTRGMLKWLGVGGQPADVPSGFQNVANDTTGTQTETTFNAVLQELYEANGMPGGQLTLIAGPGLKREISNFARQEGSTTALSYQVTQAAESKKVTYRSIFTKGLRKCGNRTSCSLTEHPDQLLSMQTQDSLSILSM